MVKSKVKYEMLYANESKSKECNYYVKVKIVEEHA